MYLIALHPAENGNHELWTQESYALSLTTLSPNAQQVDMIAGIAWFHDHDDILFTRIANILSNQKDPGDISYLLSQHQLMVIALMSCVLLRSREENRCAVHILFQD